MIERNLTQVIESLLSRYPAVGLLGPRQVGKTTLAFEVAKTRPSLYLDLELPSHRAKLAEAEAYLLLHEDKLVILDEIQRMPELFQVLRGLIDRGRRSGHVAARFLLLGSASLDLLQQSSETLAGRIIYRELYSFNIVEVFAEDSATFHQLWVRGGFPSSFLAENDAISLEWRRAFIKTYLERDIPSLAPRIPAETLRRFWTMLAHSHGGTLNAARIATGLNISGATVARYLDLMVDLLLIRRLPPWSFNTGKRLVKSPKVYVRDSGILHALLGVDALENLLGHPIVGASFEGYVLENIMSVMPDGAEVYFYRTAAGAEIDVVIAFNSTTRWAIEIKRSLSPTVTKGFHMGCEDIKPAKRFVIYSGVETFSLGGGVMAISLHEMMQVLMEV